MNILLICSKSPYPPKEGSSIAIFNIINGLLKENHNVSVLSVSTPKFFINKRDLPPDFAIQTNFESVFIDTTPSFFGVIKNLFSKKSYHISRFESVLFEEKLISLLKKNNFDIIQFEGLFVAPYINVVRNYSKSKIILRAHNIEHVIWQRIAKEEKNIFKKIYLNIQTKRLKKYELSVVNLFDGIAAITDIDNKYFIDNKCRVPISTIPFGIDENKRSAENVIRDIPSLFFLGSLNWIPNIEGLKWFIENVWEDVVKIYPSLQFYIAGRHTPMWLSHIKIKNIIVVGEVDDAILYMKSKSIMIVPLFSGSGMRVKIIEGMYAGNAVISTTIGAEGIDYTEGNNILIADTIEEFIKAISYCVEKPENTIKIGENAKTLIASKYLNDSIIKKLTDFYNEISVNLTNQ